LLSNNDEPKMMKMGGTTPTDNGRVHRIKRKQRKEKKTETKRGETKIT
jgi:hypothetical protein